MVESGMAGWILLGVGVILGVLLGLGSAWLYVRRQAPAQSAEELREEFDEYRDEVTAHFQKTSELFMDMTERYRDVYTHLASGAQKLSLERPENPQLDIVTHRLLTERAGDPSGQGPPDGEADAEGTRV